MKIFLNNNWQFFPTWTEDIFTDIQGEEVRLPHSNVTTPFNCFDESIYQFVSGYKRVLTVEDTQGTHLVTFEGVGHYAEVYLNGNLVTTHSCGYTAFTADVTPHVKQGANQLVVKVDSRETLNQPPFGGVIDYLTYGGIYREVYYQRKQGVFFDSVFAKALPNKPLMVDVVLANVQNALPANVKIEVLTQQNVLLHTFCGTLQDAHGTVVAPTVFNDLQLWDVNSPNLYVLRATVGQDVFQTTFGVRSARFCKDGFYLNGKKLKIVGLNRHQSYPYVGYAMPQSLQRQDARILKHTLGCNAVRTSHYPQSHHFVDECDRLGLLVFTEIPGWQHIGDEAWQQLALDNVGEMVTQYRNHPSVILWGVRINESLDNDALYASTNALAHLLDDTRQTGGVRYLRNSHLLEDVYTFNDFNRDGASNRKGVCAADVPYLVTEYNGHMYPTKPYDDAPHRRAHVLRYAQMLDGVFAAPNTCGCFGWCMFDYNTHNQFGAGDRICYHGVLDMFRNPKWASGVFSSLAPQPYLDVAFLTDIGDYPEGAIGEMYVLTNAQKVKVFKGNTLVGTFTHQNSPFKHLPNAPILVEDLIGDRLITEQGFTPKNSERTKRCLADLRKHGLHGLPLRTKLTIARIMLSQKLTMQNLVAIYGKYENTWGGPANDIVVEAYNGDTLVASKHIGSMTSYHLDTIASHTTLVEADTYDVASVRILCNDQNGNRCTYVNKVVNLRVEGDIELIGPTQLALMGGMGGTYVKSTGKSGSGTLFVDDVAIHFSVQTQN